MIFSVSCPAFFSEHAGRRKVESSEMGNRDGLKFPYCSHEGIEEMSQVDNQTKITMSCPACHRVRGGANLVGHTVRCPKCQAEFVFAPARPEPDSRKVTDTGVMRILGDMSDSGMPVQGGEVPLRPCSRCGVAIPESLTVCSHCNCYVGVMPSFMKQITDSFPQRN